MYCSLGILLLVGGVEKTRTDYAFPASMNILIGLLLTAGTLLFYKLGDQGNPFKLGFTFRFKDFIFSFFICLISVLIVMIFLAVKSNDNNIGMTLHLEKLTSMSYLSLLAFACIAWMVGVLQEEVLARGYFFANLHRIGIIGMLIVSGILFSLIHIPTKGFHPIELLIHFIGGLAYGYIYLKSGSLFLSAIVHGFHNFLLDILFNGDYDATLITLNNVFTDIDKLILQTATVLFLLIATYLTYGIRNGILTPAEHLQKLWQSSKSQAT